VSSRPGQPDRAIEKVPFLRTLARFPPYLIALSRAAQTVEILHVFAGSFSSFLIATAPAVVMGRLRKKTVLVHYHSGRADRHLRQSRLTRFALRACDAVVVPSQFLERIFRAHHLEAQVVPNVIDLSRFQYRPRDPLRPRFLCTRNWEAQYGLDVVIRAYAEVRKQFAEAGLCLVGRGSSRPTLMKIAEDLKVDGILFKGAVHPDEMQAVYDDCDIFLNGSYVDCSPVSILEAFSSGLPVVTSSAGGIPELVQDGVTGLLSPPGDWTALARNMLRLLRQPEFARVLAGQARNKVEANSWETVRHQWLAIYQDLCGKVT
jgi:glycosyltransferase involved in cell wall biosynthesis